MITTKLTTITDKNTWDSLHEQTKEYNIYQTFEWGEFKKTEGWEPKRFMLKTDDIDFTIAQALEKKFLNKKIIWLPGGPIFSKNSSFKSYDSFLKEIVKHYSAYTFVLRINQQYPSHPTINFLLDKHGFIRPETKRTSGYTMYVNTTDFEKRTAKNWRLFRNYKASLKNDFDFIVCNDDSLYSDVLKIYNETVTLKKLKNVPDFSHIYTLHKYLRDNVLTFIVRHNGIAVSAMVVLKCRTMAFEYMAGTSHEGRKTYSSHFLIYKILEWLKDNGIELFDLSGVDPKDDGVFTFKRGIGGELIQFVGEWEISNSFFLKKMLNMYLIMQN
ncbi:methicillin resistance protein [Candidatus Magnetobacterium bavaricum]|uniref:Methicillin resistance protein n=1 Tax=Candidatus Magnetobacterium bavaricum TaxID=29290 RepID=A0A0F3GH97_9BACT|nr:methicillin resistance protein [Candidatus Magnetobacterium bavaricum]